VTVLRPGELRVRYNDNKDVEWFAISGGYLQVHEDKVIVLADAATHASQVDVERARRAKSLRSSAWWVSRSCRARARRHRRVRADLKWCEVQLQVAERRS